MAIIKQNGTYNSILKVWLNKRDRSVKEGAK
jgi:hypothetical protein